MERRGSGLRKILESYEHEHKYKKELKPEFISTQSSFVVILKNLNYDLGNEPQNEPQKNSKQDKFEKLKEIIVYEPQVTMAKISKMLGVSEATVKRDISQLRKIGVIEYVGSSRMGKWIVKQKYAQA